MPTKRNFLLCLLLRLSVPIPALAQDSTIQGLVTDESGAVLPGAKIVMTNVATGVAKTVETNDQGFFSVSLPAPAVYDVEAVKTGFSSLKQRKLKLDVGQTARVDLTLKVGATAESIEVSASATLLDSQTTVVGQVIDNKRIVELPLNGRNYLELARLTTAVAPSTGSRPDAKGSFSALGQHGYQTSVILDGVDNNSRASGGQLGFEAQVVTPSVDAVAGKRVEFRAEMFNFTNTPNFGLPNPNINLPQGGRITSAADPRHIQFGLKFVF